MLCSSFVCVLVLFTLDNLVHSLIHSFIFTRNLFLCLKIDCLPAYSTTFISHFHRETFRIDLAVVSAGASSPAAIATINGSAILVVRASGYASGAIGVAPSSTSVTGVENGRLGYAYLISSLSMGKAYQRFSGAHVDLKSCVCQEHVGFKIEAAISISHTHTHTHTHTHWVMFMITIDCQVRLC